MRWSNASPVSTSRLTSHRADRVIQRGSSQLPIALARRSGGNHSLMISVPSLLTRSPGSRGCESLSRDRGSQTINKFAKRGLTLTLAQDFREARDWFVQHKRDPFLWLVILGPLVLASITFWGLVVFPPSYAVEAVRQVVSGAEVTLFAPKNFPKCRGQTYIFGYDFGIRTEQDTGRVCRDVVNGGWVVDITRKLNLPESR